MGHLNEDELLAPRKGCDIHRPRDCPVLCKRIYRIKGNNNVKVGVETIACEK
jgi:hypothetical protein